MKPLFHFLKYRPLSILAMAGAVRDILLGIGFIVGWTQITQTLIYQNYDELWPGYSGMVAGIVFVVIGIGLIWAAINTKRDWLVHALNVQAFFWLFSTLMYALNGHFLLAMIFGVFFTFPAGFTAFYVKYNPPLDHIIRGEAKS